MAARSIGSGTISFGLVSIPFKLYTAASSQSVKFHQLHGKCGGRIKYQVYCPTDDEVVERKELIKGYEYAKDQYVRFENSELKALEAEKSHILDIVEFVPLDTVDLIYVDKSYYLGPDKGGAKAYRLLSRAMEDTGKVAIGRHTARGKEQLVIVRPYKNGLLLHQVYYADEVRAFEDIDLGEDVGFKPGEPELAQQLIAHLSAEDFEPQKYRDEFRDRVLAAVEQKVAGEEITLAPEQPTAQIIDLFDALKASLGAGAAKVAKAEAPVEGEASEPMAPAKASRRKKRAKKKKAAGE